MWFKTSILISCLLLQSCAPSFMNWGTSSRGPASADANLEELARAMSGFKARVMGSETDSKCTKEQLDEDFNKLMASMKRNSCSVSNYTIDREEFNQRSCPKIKTPGYFDKVVRVTIKEEKDNKKDKDKYPLTFFQSRVTPEFLGYHKEAQRYLRSVGDVVNNEEVPVKHRAQLIALYVDNVLLPIRDLVIIMRAYLPKEDDGSKFYESLLLNLPDEFVRELDTTTKGMVTMGLNPQSSPYYLEIKSQQNGSHLLDFADGEILKRDVLTLLKAPTAKNYVVALKWMTLHMMISQIYLYEILTGGKGEVNVPRSCQGHFNGSLPASFKFTYEDGAGDQFLESILANHGLIAKQDDNSYFEYYLENVNNNPTKAGYSGLIPFENYKNALRSSEKSGALALEPQFDDIAHFQSIMSFKMGEAMSVFKGKMKGQSINFIGIETFQKMLGQFSPEDVADIKVSATETKQIYPGKQNLSPYVLELMQANGFLDYSQLITEKMKKKFVGRKVKIDFPSMYSSPAWRDWSLKVLSDLAYKHKDDPANSKTFNIARDACLMTTRKTQEMLKICKPGTNALYQLSDYLAEFRSGEKYIPSRRLEEGKFQEVYPFLGNLWTKFRDQLHLIPEAEPFEMNFLLDQMAAGNPWARLKFSYMVALDQIEYQEEGIHPQYDGRAVFSKNNNEIMCKLGNLSTQYNNLVSAGKILGLDKPLNYNHAGNFLSSKEKIQVWREIVDDIQKSNAQLFTVKDGNKSYYQKAEDLSYKTILTEADAFKSERMLTQKATKEIKEVTELGSSELANFFLQLYNLKDPAKQQKLYEEFSKVNGIDNTFSVKLAFLALDESYKKPIYKTYLQLAAEARRLQIITQLDRFCKMDVNDENQFKNIFYSTSKAQNDINKAAGLPAVPEEVLDQINEMTAGEWRDMWWGIGSGIAGMAALIVGGACTTLSGGICAPLGGAMAVAGLSALGIQVKLTANELERHDLADKNAKEIKIMEDLGFANTGSSEEVSRSYAWVAFEAISIFPLIGIATRAASLGPKLAYVGTREALRKTGKLSFKAAAKSATQEEEVRAAQYLLGATSISKNMGVNEKALEAAKLKIAKIKVLYTSGNITFEEMMSRAAAVLAPIKRAKLALARTARGEIGKVTVKQSKDQIDTLATKMITNYFADNPKEMLRFIQDYSGERLMKAQQIMAEVNAVDRVGQIPIYSSARDWILKLRNESLAKNSAKILRIERELKALGTGSDKLEGFVKKNIDDLTDIFIDIPMKKRELPYFVFVQGMPEFNFIKGRKIPFLSSMSKGQTVKKIFMARARLVEESYKAQARQALGLKRHVHSETTYDAFKSFQKSVAELAMKKEGAEKAQIIADYRRLEMAMAKKLFTEFKGNPNIEYKSFNEMMANLSRSSQKAELEAFKDLIFSPKNLKEKAQAQAIWESVPADELMRMKEVNEFAHRAVQQLSKYSDIDSFERYLSALKILTINRNSAVLEVM